MSKKQINPFVKRDEIMLIKYEDVIKCPSAGILELIKKDYIDDLKDFININKLMMMDSKNIQRYAIERPYLNILDYIKTKEFDTEKIYNALYNAYDTIYMDLPLMKIGSSIYILSLQKFVKKIYIYSETYDKKIEYDIKENYFELNNVFYVAGSLKDILNNIERPTTYILNNIEDVEILIQENKIQFSEIMIPQYGYNYRVDNSVLKFKGNYDELTHEKIFKIVSFIPLNMDDSYYTI